MRNVSVREMGENVEGMSMIFVRKKSFFFGVARNYFFLVAMRARGAVR